MRYQKLLSPLMIGGQIIKNRLTYPNASPHFLQGPETFPADGYRAFAAELAKNSAAIVSFAEWANFPQQRQGPIDMDMTHMQAFAYAGTVPVFYAIGDCNGAGNLETCNREAYARAMIL